MGLSLTTWWDRFEADLSLLAIKKNNDANSPWPDNARWNAAREMIDFGRAIESASAWAKLGYDGKINKASEVLGASFKNEVEKSDVFLPDVTNPDELLFAWVYYKHLQRYQEIDKGNFFVLEGVKLRVPGVKRSAQELYQRITNYCTAPDHVDAVYLAFPEIKAQQGETLLLKVEQWFTAKPAAATLDLEAELEQQEEGKEKTSNFLFTGLEVVDKLALQLEVKTQNILNMHSFEDPETNIIPIFDQLGSVLTNQISVLRKIASGKKLLQTLTDNYFSPENYQQEFERLEEEHPLFVPQLHSLKAEIKALIQENTVPASRTSIAAAHVKYLGSKLGSLVKGTVGRITPTNVSNMAGTVVKKISHVTDSIIPPSGMKLETIHAQIKQRQKAFIESLKDETEKTASALNLDDNKVITSQDFQNLQPEQVYELADRIELIQSLVALNRYLAEYQHKYRSGFVEFSLSLIIKPITELMSQSILRPLIFDKVLLVMEAKRLGDQVEQLIHSAKADTEFNKDEFNARVSTTLEEAKQRTLKIPEKSIHVFFKEQSTKATQNLTQVVEKVTPPRR